MTQFTSYRDGRFRQQVSPANPAYTTVQLCDFAAVPVRGAAGLGIALGEFLNGAGSWTGYRHVTGYAGYFTATPQLVPGSPYARVHPKFIDGDGAGHYVFEAQPGGARLRRLEGRPEDIPGSLWSTGAFSLSKTTRTVMADSIPAECGIPYSWLDYDALAAHRLRIPVPGLKDYIEDTGHQICSQLWDWKYAKAGVHLFTDSRWPGYVTPFDMARAIIAAGQPDPR